MVEQENLTRHDRQGYEMVINNLRQQVAQVDKIQSQADKAQHRLEAIDNYDRVVKATIASDERLREAWDNFAVMYQMVASDELLTRARDKAYRSERNTQTICSKCRIIMERPRGDLSEWNSSYE